ncbi:hypothetical protein CMUS01_05038 [Colletotrichum musicola]|uniref:Uncharacterized protein n=1 Tax=Colletotrichum musicola TaxID=2175873 RepID=A0A8H6KTG3_9PEZI|nr:hypothetical protein CMUS01_05038 [Colletotrichum musicola]
MSNQYIDELTNSSIQKFTRYLSLPTRFNSADPPDEWLRGQEAGLRKLPSVLRRPENDSLTNLFQRGLMKISEKQSLPLVPDSAVLCRSHRGLNPWRIRSLFVLVASEVTDKLERTRRPVRKNSDLAQDPEFRDFVWRMTSVQGLWMERAEYRRLYEHAPLRKEMVVSQCEACICAVVGGDPRLLVDFKAHLHSRARKFQPVLLRVVEAWIDASGDRAAGLHADGAVLGEKLRRIRADIGARRHDRRQRHREAGKAVPYSKAKHDDVSKAASHSSRLTGGGSGGEPADYFSDVDDYEYDDVDERQLGSHEDMDERRRGFYQQRDINCSHSAFHDAGSRSTAPLAESSMPTRDVSRNRDTLVRGRHSELEGVGATRPTRQSSQSRTSRPPRAASSAYSTSSMAQRQSDDLSEFERLAISNGNNGTGVIDRGRLSPASSHHRPASTANYPPSASRSGHTTNPARVSPERETTDGPASAVDASFGMPPPDGVLPAHLVQTPVRGSLVDVGGSLVDGSLDGGSVDESALDDSAPVVSSPHVRRTPVGRGGAGRRVVFREERYEGRRE